MELVEEVRIAVETLEVVLAHRPAKSLVGDDVVEVAHEIRLGHHGQGLDVLDGHLLEVDGG